MIRPARTWDLLRLIGMGEAYAEEVGAYAGLTYDSSVAALNCLNAIQSPNQCVLVSSEKGVIHGFIWGLIAPILPWSQDLIAIDQILYVDPEYRGKIYGRDLVRAYYDWASENGAKEVRISVGSGIHHDRTENFYEKLGYTKVGSQYRKGVQI